MSIGFQGSEDSVIELVVGAVWAATYIVYKKSDLRVSVDSIWNGPTQPKSQGQNSSVYWDYKFSTKSQLMISLHSLQYTTRTK